MRNEAEFCTCIGHSLDWHYKIPDIGNCKKPHDGYGILNEKPVYYEAKFLKKPQAFNWSRLEDHQLESLYNIQKNCPSASVWVIIGVDFGRADKRAYIWTNMDEVKRRKDGKVSVLKKEFETLPYYPIKKGKIVWELVTPEK